FLNLEPLSFVRIDPAARTITDRIASPVDDVSSFAIDGDSLWVGHGSHPTLVRVDIRTGREADRYEYPEDGDEEVGLLGPVVGDGSVWITRGDQVLRIEPGSGDVQATIRVGAVPDGYMSFSEGKVWVPGFGELLWIDPATNGLVASSPLYASGLQYTVGGGGFGWVTQSDGNEVYQFAENGGLLRGHVTGEGPESIAYGDGTIWVANHDSGTIGTIDVETGRRGSFDIGHPTRGIAFGGGLLAATVGSGSSVTDQIAAIRGSALLLAATEPFNGSVDPATANDIGMWQIERATCAKLLSYPDAAAPEGWELRPEVASVPPEVSGDGRTYTFTIREGFAFSPPSTELVTAETFRYSIERALSPELGARAPGYRFLPDIQGVDAFRAGESDHIEGLVAAGDSLTITLEEPSGDFLHRLAMPFFCPVPTDTPILEGGVGADPLPSTGPYFVSENEEAEVLILQRNPNYAGERPSFHDAIVVRFGLDLFDVREGPRAGDWDGVVGFSIDLFRGANSGYVGFDTRPLGTLDFLVLNARGDAFSTPDVRAAAALATDRFTFTVFDGIPTDAFLPPDLPGADGAITATLPDPERAKRLLGGRRVDVSMAISPGLGRYCDDALAACRGVAIRMRESLEEAGFRVDVQTIARSEFLRDPDRFDLAFGFASIEYPDTATFVSAAILDGSVPSWFPEDVRREAIRLRSLSGEARTAAAVTLADRLVEEHLVVPLGNLPRSSYATGRIGCLVYPPFGWGFDLVTLCPSG
ncbi:MAG: ABC transporter substrate-binding protein, partial [Actinomycetota bacterium]